MPVCAHSSFTSYLSIIFVYLRKFWSAALYFRIFAYEPLIRDDYIIFLPDCQDMKLVVTVICAHSADSFYQITDTARKLTADIFNSYPHSVTEFNIKRLAVKAGIYRLVKLFKLFFNKLRVFFHDSLRASLT